MQENVDLPKLVSALHQHRVNYVLVGGLAVFLHGGETPTMDVDLAFDRSGENIERLADALAEVGAKPQRWSAAHYRLTPGDLASSWLHLDSDVGKIDLLARTPGVTYSELERDCVLFQVGEIFVRVASVASLAAMKKEAGRDRDKRHLEELEAIKKLRDSRTE